MDVHRYRHCGLILEANVAFRGLPSAPAGPPDVSVELVRCSERPQLDPDWVLLDGFERVWRAPAHGSSHLRVLMEGLTPDDWADFLITAGGDQVRISIGPAAHREDAAELFLGNPFSCVLGQRGVTCLHAGVVAIEHHAVALIGAKGGGKSTLSLALAQRGAVLVSDDVAPIVTRDGVFGVPGGRSALRMRPDAAASFGVTAGDHPAVYASVESPTAKRLVDLAGPGRPDPSWLPLGAVFILAPRGSAKAVEVRALSAGDLLPVLLGNRHMPRLLDPAGHRRDFSCLGALAQAVPGRRLVRPDDLDAVGSAAEAVIDATRRLYAGDESVGSLSA